MSAQNSHCEQLQKIPPLLGKLISPVMAVMMSMNVHPQLRLTIVTPMHFAQIMMDRFFALVIQPISVGLYLAGWPLNLPRILPCESENEIAFRWWYNCMWQREMWSCIWTFLRTRFGMSTYANKCGVQSSWCLHNLHLFWRLWTQFGKYHYKARFQISKLQLKQVTLHQLVA